MDYIFGVLTGVIASWFVQSIKKDKTEVEAEKREQRELENPDLSDGQQ